MDLPTSEQSATVTQSQVLHQLTLVLPRRPPRPHKCLRVQSRTMLMTSRMLRGRRIRGLRIQREVRQLHLSAPSFQHDRAWSSQHIQHGTQSRIRARRRAGAEQSKDKDKDKSSRSRLSTTSAPARDQSSQERADIDKLLGNGRRGTISWTWVLEAVDTLRKTSKWRAVGTGRYVHG